MKKTFQLNTIKDGKVSSVYCFEFSGNTAGIELHRLIKVSNRIAEKIVKSFINDGLTGQLKLTSKFENGCYQLETSTCSYIGCMSGNDFIITDEYEF